MGFVIIDGAAANFLDQYWGIILVLGAGISIFIGNKIYRRYRKKRK